MDNIDKYISTVEAQIKTFKTQEKGNLDKASTIIAEAMAKDKWLYVFGTGHSHIIAEEFFYRAGGLVRVYPMLDTALMLHEGAVKSTSLERLSGYAEALLNDYPVTDGDVIIISSNSGRNAVPIEMAIGAKKRGMKVIVLTSMVHTKIVTSRHASGKKLYEFADVVIDNCGVFGDACVEIGDSAVAPTSTVIGAIVVNSIVAGTVEKLHNLGKEAEFYMSSNTDHGEKKNQLFIKKYKDMIRSL